MLPLHTCDVFCRVVDNFGDAAVCWRLARQLACEHGAVVRLWIDDLAPLQRLVPDIASGAADQKVDGIRVEQWSEPMRRVEPADIVIEAFGCGLPDAYVAQMAARARKPAWIVLEYLSAEEWVPEHHELPSPHPRWPLERFFFFPGFVPGTGGLLREAGLLDRRDRFGAAECERFWRSVGHEPPPPRTLTVSLFSYESAPVGELLQACHQLGEPTVFAVPESKASRAALRYFGVAGPPSERVFRRGCLELRLLPFVEQSRYDELLWSCDVNFVRGEDSFVRAQWAAKPFVWHIYPQAEGAHAAKLAAFLELYSAGLEPGAREAVVGLTRWWNQLDTGRVTPATAWQAFVRAAPVVRDHGANWCRQIAGVGSLAEHLARFCAGKLK